MGELKILRTSLSYEENMVNRIEGFRRDVLDGDGSMEHINAILDICHEYLSKYEDDDLYHATIKIKESIFFIDCFTS